MYSTTAGGMVASSLKPQSSMARRARRRQRRARGLEPGRVPSSVRSGSGGACRGSSGDTRGCPVEAPGRSAVAAAGPPYKPTIRCRSIARFNACRTRTSSNGGSVRVDQRGNPSAAPRSSGTGPRSASSPRASSVARDLVEHPVRAAGFDRADLAPRATGRSARRSSRGSRRAGRRATTRGSSGCARATTSRSRRARDPVRPGTRERLRAEAHARGVPGGTGRREDERELEQELRVGPREVERRPCASGHRRRSRGRGVQAAGRALLARRRGRRSGS